jgi:hypothetical protein
MQKKPKTYPIEKAAEKLLNEVRIGIKKIVIFFFTIPKKKDDKMIYVIETLAWILLTIAIIWRTLD